MSYDLNALVNEGKEDVLQYLRKNIFDKTRGDEWSAIYAMFFLAVKKEQAELDIYRTRTMLIDENYKLLAGAGDDGAPMIEAMAVAAGRVSQIQECFGALRRMTMAGAEEYGPGMAGGLKMLQDMIEELEKVAVRMSRAADGRILLSPLPQPEEAMAQCL